MPWSLFNDELLPILEQSLTWRSRRHEVIAGNVANLDTPHYSRRELDFQGILTSYLQGGPRVNLAATHSAHIADNGHFAGLVRNSGEPVDLDREMAQMSENQLSYQASVQMLTKKLESLRTVIEGDRA